MHDTSLPSLFPIFPILSLPGSHAQKWRQTVRGGAIYHPTSPSLLLTRLFHWLLPWPLHACYNTHMHIPSRTLPPPPLLDVSPAHATPRGGRYDGLVEVTVEHMAKLRQQVEAAIGTGGFLACLNHAYDGHYKSMLTVRDILLYMVRPKRY